MLLSLSILGIILSILLVCFNFRTLASAKYLGGFFLFLSLYCFIMYVILYSKSVWLVSIVFINIGFLSYLIGPMLYWYVRGVLTDRAQLKRSDLWHLLPMLIFLIGVVPYMLRPFSYKTEIAARLVEDADNLVAFGTLFLFKVIPISAVYLSRPILALGYTLWAVGLFFSYLGKKRDTSVLSKQRFMITWLSILLGFLLVLTVSHVLQIVQTVLMKNTTPFYGLTFLKSLSGIGLAGLLISPFFFPAILYGLPRLPHAKVLGSAGGLQNVVEGADESSKTPGFESDYLRLIDQKIKHCMEHQQAYLKPDLNLAALSALSRIPVHHLAYFFKEVKKQHFIDYRNQLRVEHAKRLILEGKALEMTLEGVGLSSGFSSRKTFYNAFMKFEHLCPSSFLAHHTDS